MGGWPLASCQEQQQCCDRQKDTREVPGRGGGRTGGPATGRGSTRFPRLSLGQVRKSEVRMLSCWTEHEILHGRSTLPSSWRGLWVALSLWVATGPLAGDKEAGTCQGTG